MLLRKLSLTGFKNYTSARLEFSPTINCFVGNNGAGKTNLLDAVYYLSFCKSYFNPIDSQNIHHEEDFFLIKGDYEFEEGVSIEVSCAQQRDTKKSFRLGKKEYNRLADHIGKIPLVMVSPYDRDLINEGSELRRKFMDAIISQFNKQYLGHLIDYNRALTQRNQLLKLYRGFDAAFEDNLTIWDERLHALSHPVFEARTEFVADFQPIFQEHYAFISGSNEKVDISYQSQLSEHEHLDLLRFNRNKDLHIGYTTAGIHKDDLVLQINGYPLKKFASQGQQKSTVVAMRLAQFDFIHKQCRFKPILLLDDIFDKLDDSRVERLIHLVADQKFGQVLITDTQKERIHKIFDEHKLSHRIFRVIEGSVHLINGDGQ